MTLYSLKNNIILARRTSICQNYPLDFVAYCYSVALKIGSSFINYPNYSFCLFYKGFQCSEDFYDGLLEDDSLYDEEATSLSSSAAIIELLTTLFEYLKAALLPCYTEL